MRGSFAATISPEASIGRLPSVARHRPKVSKFSKANPSGSNCRWQAAHRASAVAASMRCRVVSPGGDGSGGVNGTPGGGGGSRATQEPRAHEKAALGRRRQAGPVLAGEEGALSQDSRPLRRGQIDPHERRRALRRHRQAVVLGDVAVHVRVRRGEERREAAVAPEDIVDEGLRFGDQIGRERGVPFGVQGRRLGHLKNVVQAEPLPVEPCDHGVGARIVEHSRDLRPELVDRRQLVVIGRREQGLVGHRAPHEVRQSRRELVGGERKHLGVRRREPPLDAIEKVARLQHPGDDLSDPAFVASRAAAVGEEILVARHLFARERPPECLLSEGSDEGCRAGRRPRLCRIAGRGEGGKPRDGGRRDLLSGPSVRLDEDVGDGLAIGVVAERAPLEGERRRVRDVQRRRGRDSHEIAHGVVVLESAQTAQRRTTGVDRARIAVAVASVETSVTTALLPAAPPAAPPPVDTSPPDAPPAGAPSPAVPPAPPGPPVAPSPPVADEPPRPDVGCRLPPPQPSCAATKQASTVAALNGARQLGFAGPRSPVSGRLIARVLFRPAPSNVWIAAGRSRSATALSSPICLQRAGIVTKPSTAPTSRGTPREGNETQQQAPPGGRSGETARSITCSGGWTAPMGGSPAGFYQKVLGVPGKRHPGARHSLRLRRRDPGGARSDVGGANRRPAPSRSTSPSTTSRRCTSAQPNSRRWRRSRCTAGRRRR